MNLDMFWQHQEAPRLANWASYHLKSFAYGVVYKIALHYRGKEQLVSVSEQVAELMHTSCCTCLNCRSFYRAHRRCFICDLNNQLINEDGIPIEQVA